MYNPYLGQAFMDQLCEKKPDLVTREIICKSIQNREVLTAFSIKWFKKEVTKYSSVKQTKMR
jgi:hypothetical protein